MTARAQAWILSRIAAFARRAQHRQAAGSVAIQ